MDDFEFGKMLQHVAGGLPHESVQPALRLLVKNLLATDTSKYRFEGSVYTVDGKTAKVDNAIDAIGQAGELALHTYRQGDDVVVEVCDSGPGIPPEVQARIFDPFFTTKFTGRGLGLAAVQGIVRSHKGFIQIQSASGAGATFKVFLPISGKPANTGSGAVRS